MKKKDPLGGGMTRRAPGIRRVPKVWGRLLEVISQPLRREVWVDVEEGLRPLTSIQIGMEERIEQEIEKQDGE